MTIDEFVIELMKISSDKRKLPLVIECPNGLLVEPKVKMKMKDGHQSSGVVESMVITYG